MISSSILIIILSGNHYQVGRDGTSDETIIANHPWVTDAQAEGDRMSRESEEKMKQMQEVMGEGVVPGFGEEASEEGGEE